MMMTPLDAVRCVLHHWRSVLLTATVTAGLVAAAVLLWPNAYRSDGLLYVRLGRGAVSLDPTVRKTESVSLQESRSSEVVSVVEMLGSRELADRVVTQIGAKRITHSDSMLARLLAAIPRPSGDQAVGGWSPAEVREQLEREEAVKQIQQSIDVSIPKTGYTVAISAKANDPLLARDIVQAIIDQFGRLHVEAHRSIGSLSFFENQCRESHQAAVAARDRLQRARTERGWLSTASAEKALQQRIMELELAYDAANSEVAEAEARVSALREGLASVEPWISVEVTKVADDATNEMLGQLYDTRLTDGEKLAKVTPNHPRYKIIRDKIDQGQELIDNRDGVQENQREAINPVHLKLNTDLKVAIAGLSGSRSRRDATASSLADARADLRRLNDDAVELAQLSWAADIAEENHLAHAKSVESARVTAALDRDEMSDVSIIQDASLNLKKASPPRLLLLLAGGMMGLFAGVFQALVRGVNGGAVGPADTAPRKSDSREFGPWSADDPQFRSGYPSEPRGDRGVPEAATMDLPRPRPQRRDRVHEPRREGELPVGPRIDANVDEAASLLRAKPH